MAGTGVGTVAHAPDGLHVTTALSRLAATEALGTALVLAQVAGAGLAAPAWSRLDPTPTE